MRYPDARDWLPEYRLIVGDDECNDEVAVEFFESAWLRIGRSLDFSERLDYYEPERAKRILISYFDASHRVRGAMASCAGWMARQGDPLTRLMGTEISCGMYHVERQHPKAACDDGRILRYFESLPLSAACESARMFDRWKHDLDIQTKEVSGGIDSAGNGSDS